MKKLKNHQHPRREYRFDIVDHKKPKKSGETVPLSPISVQSRTELCFQLKRSVQ
jgi:hypothetical protein